MFYSEWENKKNMIDTLRRIDYKKNVERSGLPIVYEKDYVYATKGDGHTLIVGTTGSGKTQTLILPLIKLSMLANESVVVNDPKGDLYHLTAKEFKNRGYNVIVLDYDNALYGNYYNPLTLPFNLYKENNKDRCTNVLEEIGYYFFKDNKSNSDPFWENSTIDFFTGLCLYLFEKSKDEINLKNVFDLANKLCDEKECKKFLDEIGTENAIYYNVSGTLKAPTDTKGSIISVFNQKIKRFVSKENLSEMMNKTDFDLKNISNEKTIVYIVSGYYDYCNVLIPLFIHQVFEVVNSLGNNNRKINVILDEFDNLLPIRNFSEIINYSRSININFTVVIKSFVNLINTYGKDNIEIIKLCFSNIVYLYANDLYTLEEIQRICGNENENKPLVSIEELKTIEPFNAIFLIPRMMPYKTKLIPDFKIEWNINFEREEFKLRNK